MNKFIQLDEICEELPFTVKLMKEKKFPFAIQCFFYLIVDTEILAFKCGSVLACIYHCCASVIEDFVPFKFHVTRKMKRMNMNRMVDTAPLEGPSFWFS